MALALAIPSGVGADAVDDYVKGEMARQRIPGLSLALCRNGQITKAEGYGLANVELDVPVRPETVFQSGSVGKQFTATAAMMLVEEGKLGLDHPITRYLPGGAGWWKDVTVRHLLTHTSGIHDWGEQDIDYRRDYTEDELVKRAAALPRDFRPGTQWSYSNTAYCLLGIVIRKASGQFYGDFLKARVFEPLAMTDTRIISEADIVKNRAAGYRLEKDTLLNQEWVSPSLNTTADGSLYLTALDLARWDAALYGERLLKASSLQQMWTPVGLADGSTYPYGFGWSLDEQRGQTAIEHGGSWQGFKTHIARYVDQKLTVIALANLAQADPTRIAHAVAGIVEPSLRLPDPRQERRDPDPKRTAAVREVLEAWGQGKPSPRMAKGLRGTNASTERERFFRRRTAERLQKATSFAFLDEDDVTGAKMARRGEPIARILHYGLIAPEGAQAYRFYMTSTGEVADFDGEER